MFDMYGNRDQPPLSVLSQEPSTSFLFVLLLLVCFYFVFEVGSVIDPELTEFAKLAGQEASGSQSPVSTSVMLRVKLHIIMSPLFHAGSGNQTQGLMLAPQNLY